MVDLEWNRKTIFEKLDWLKDTLEDVISRANQNTAVHQEQLKAITTRLTALEKPTRKGKADMASKPSLGAHLRNARKKLKLRVRDVAAIMDISDSAIYCWKTDRKSPNDANLTALCEILKLSLKATRAIATA